MNKQMVEADTHIYCYRHLRCVGYERATYPPYIHCIAYIIQTNISTRVVPSTGTGSTFFGANLFVVTSEGGGRGRMDQRQIAFVLVWSYMA